MMIRKIVLFLYMVFSLVILLHAQRTVVMCDTSFSDPLIYNRFFEMAKQAGLNITYYGLGDLIDMSIDQIQVEKYDAAFFILNDELVMQMKNHASDTQQEISPLQEKFLKLIQQHARVSGTLTGLFLPEFGGIAYRKLKTGHPLTVYSPIFSYFGISVNPQGILVREATSQQAGDFKGTILKSRLEQLLVRPTIWAGKYATSLIPGSDDTIKTMHTQGDSLAVFIPLLYKDHQLFIANGSMTWYASVSEHFKIAPLDLEIQKKLDEDIFFGIKNIVRAIDQLKGEKAGEDISLNRSSLEGSVKFISDSKQKNVLAWMDIDLFADKKLQQDQARLIEVIDRGNFDGLWLSIGPNQYFSARAKFYNRREELGQAIARFSQMLRLAYEKKQKKLPDIFISFEIANNFVDNYKYPQKQMIDLFGNLYSDIPEPLDRGWWNDEVVISAERFVPFWRTYAEGLEIKGFFIDLEMYLRNDSGIGSFVSTAQGTSVHETLLTTRRAKQEGGYQVIRELMALKSGKSYYQQLITEAEKLGLWLKKSLQKIVPECRVACYAASVSLDWFYQGLYKGLSSESDPLWLCSFNSRFNWFKVACNEKKLYVEHFTVLMLSHMKSADDFPLFKTLLSRNDGIWLNKVSRMAHEYRPDEWHKFEQTPLSYADRIRLLDVVAEK